ncbi:hypothetical protein [uncultured Tateyamaria sp.]|uniref:hypothetical protein n=1 Tax=uncultured Tateyamaria sp. TaxID=455651 RepID=UPI00261A9B0E|nr:hypothetical protein [uncultured Tateyamaria sp.]
MEFWTTLRNAELKLFGMSGKGFGAVLLAVIVLFGLYLSGHGDFLVSLVDAMSEDKRRD